MGLRPVRAREQEIVRLHLRGDQLLRQRGSVIGGHRLGVEDHHLRAGLAECPRRGVSADAVTDDDYRVGHDQPSTTTWSPSTVTLKQRTGSLAGGAVASPVSTLKVEACSGHSISMSSS